MIQNFYTAPMQLNFANFYLRENIKAPFEESPRQTRVLVL